MVGIEYTTWVVPQISGLGVLLNKKCPRVMVFLWTQLMLNNFLRTLLRQIESNEYKRRQFAPSLKVTSAAFGAGRKIPIAKVWN
jgi:NAD+ synthase (glutamine-hydrolysing)